MFNHLNLVCLEKSKKCGKRYKNTPECTCFIPLDNKSQNKLFFCTAIDRIKCFTMEGFPKTFLRVVLRIE